MKTRYKFVLLLALAALVTFSCGTFTFTQEGYTQDQLNSAVETAVAESQEDSPEAYSTHTPEEDYELTLVQECFLKKTPYGDCMAQMLADNYFIGHKMTVEVREINNWGNLYDGEWHLWQTVPGFRVTKVVKEDGFISWDLGPETRIPELDIISPSVLIASTAQLDWGILATCSKIDNYFYLCNTATVEGLTLPPRSPGFTGFTGATFIWGSQEFLERVISDWNHEMNTLP